MPSPSRLQRSGDPEAAPTTGSIPRRRAGQRALHVSPVPAGFSPQHISPPVPTCLRAKTWSKRVDEAISFSWSRSEPSLFPSSILQAVYEAVVSLVCYDVKKAEELYEPQR